MNEKELRAAFKENCTVENMKTLAVMLSVLELAELGYKVQEESIKECYKRVLAEHPFYAEEACERIGIKYGQRILEEDYTFLLSDNDCDRLNKLVIPVMAKENITDERGYFTTNWFGKKCKARRDLYCFFIDNFLPQPMREIFLVNKTSVVTQNKVIDIIKNLAK